MALITLRVRVRLTNINDIHIYQTKPKLKMTHGWKCKTRQLTSWKPLTANFFLLHLLLKKGQIQACIRTSGFFERKPSVVSIRLLVLRPTGFIFAWLFRQLCTVLSVLTQSPHFNTDSKLLKAFKCLKGHRVARLRLNGIRVGFEFEPRGIIWRIALWWHSWVPISCWYLHIQLSI